MQQIIGILHVLIALCIIALVLVQQGKGADMGAGFGGASNTMFGSQGATPFLVKLTGIFALLFFITSSVLSFIVSKEATQTNPLMFRTQPAQNIPTSLGGQQSTTPPVQNQTNSNTQQSTIPQGDVNK